MRDHRVEFLIEDDLFIHLRRVAARADLHVSQYLRRLIRRDLGEVSPSPAGRDSRRVSVTDPARFLRWGWA